MGGNIVGADSEIAGSHNMARNPVTITADKYRAPGTGRDHASTRLPADLKYDQYNS